MPKLRLFFDTFKPRDPVSKTANARNMNRIGNVLSDIECVGGHFLKPTNAEGLGWKLIIDGNSDGKDGKDTPPIEDINFPFNRRWAFGISTNFLTVSIWNARTERYPDNFEEASNPKDITASGTDDFWVGFKFDTTLCLSSPSTAYTVTGPHSSEPVSSATDVRDGKFIGALFKFAIYTDSAGNTRLRLLRDYIHGAQHLQVTT